MPDPIDTLAVDYQPTFPSTGGQHSYRLLTSRLGDGYVQQIADGLNPIDRSYTLVWGPMPRDKAAALVRFLDAHVGVPFWYRLPIDQAPRTLVCLSVRIQHDMPAHDTVTAAVEERIIFG